MKWLFLVILTLMKTDIISEFYVFYSNIFSLAFQGPVPQMSSLSREFDLEFMPLQKAGRSHGTHVRW